MIDTPLSRPRPQHVVPAGEQLWLVPIQQFEHVEPRPLTDASIDIGSASTCDLHLPIPGVDAHHCTIRFDRGRSVLTAHSRLTWVNEGPVREAVLKPGQRLAIGPVEFRLEKRTEPYRADPLQQVDCLQQRVGEEVGVAPAGLTELLARLAQMYGSLPPHTSAACEPVGAPARHRPSADGERADRDLQRKRRLVEELQASLQQQAATAIRMQRETESAQAQSRKELDRLHSELSQEQAAVQFDRAVLAQQQADLEKRLANLQQEQERLCTRDSELQQTSDELNEEQRQQYERERLLQTRIEEINREETALTEREAELRAPQSELEQGRTERRTGQEASEADTADAHGEATQPFVELASEKKRLELELSDKLRELERLRSTQAEQQTQAEEREESLRRREDETERRADEIAEREAALATKTADIEGRELALAQRHNELEQESAQIARAAEEDATRTKPPDAQTGELEERLRELNEARGRLLADRVQLKRDRDALRTESERIAAEREQLDAQQQRAAQEHTRLDEERKRLEDSQVQCDARQQGLRLLESQAAEQLSDLEQSRQDLAAHEASLQQREQQLDSRDAQTRAVEDEAAAQRQQELDRAQQELEESRASVLRQRNALEERRAELQDAEQTLNSDRERIDAVLQDLESEHHALEAVRDELAQERRQLAELRSEIRREQESLTTLRQDVAAASDGREAAFSAQSMIATETAAVSSGVDSVSLDDYEIADPNSVETTAGADGEIVDDRDSDEAPAEQAVELRSQLADMFAIPSGPRQRGRKDPAPFLAASPGETERAAMHTGSTSESAGATAAASGNHRTHPSGPSAAAPAESDSIAAYMENLMARIRGGTQNSPAVPVVASPSQNKPESTPPALGDGAAEASGRFEDRAETEKPKERTRPDATLERAHLDTFRELANRSARTAVAKHNSASLRSTFLVKAVITAALLGMTILLMTSELWVGVSYASWGFVTAAAMCVSAFGLLKTLSQMDMENAYQRQGAGHTHEDALLRVVKRMAGMAEGLTPPRSPSRSVHETPQADRLDPS